ESPHFRRNVDGLGLAVLVLQREPARGGVHGQHLGGHLARSDGGGLAGRAGGLALEGLGTRRLRRSTGGEQERCGGCDDGDEDEKPSTASREALCPRPFLVPGVIGLELAFGASPPAIRETGSAQAADCGSLQPCSARLIPSDECGGSQPARIVCTSAFVLQSCRGAFSEDTYA